MQRVCLPQTLRNANNRRLQPYGRPYRLPEIVFYAFCADEKIL
jgi:hypothetical protein